MAHDTGNPGRREAQILQELFLVAPSQPLARHVHATVVDVRLAEMAEGLDHRGDTSQGTRLGHTPGHTNAILKNSGL